MPRWQPLLANIVLVLLLAMVFTSVYGWSIERLAYRPLRGSFKLAPLISAIGVSITLQNYVQLVQGARPKAGGRLIEGGFGGGHAATVSRDCALSSEIT